ncbi:MAG: HNH endonuclease signature motif containing protein [Caldilineaceae bacterium]
MIKFYIPSGLKRAVIERANGYCEYCKCPVDWSPEIFEVEHIQPLGAGGATDLTNLAYVCPACNRYKRNRQTAEDPETAQEIELFNPRLHVWQEHFGWSTDFLLIQGLTPTGRATVIAFKMNRRSVQRFRQALIAVNAHPGIDK